MRRPRHILHRRGAPSKPAQGSQHDNCDLTAVDYDNESEGERGVACYGMLQSSS
jgi:hypothetical protein